MRNTKRILAGAIMLFAGAVLTPAIAATPDEAKDLAEKAAALVASEGDKAFPAIDDPNGPFHKGELYVAVLDHQGIVRANMVQKLIGMNLWEATDPDGVKFTQLLWTATESSPTAWVSYKFTNPETKKIEKKKTWVHRVGDYIVLCGAYVKD